MTFRLAVAVAAAALVAAGFAGLNLATSGGGTRRSALPQIDGAAGPAWSPDGKRIAFAGERNGAGGLFVVDSDGKHVGRPTSGFDNDHAWSSDGRRIAYSGYDRNDRNDRGHLYVMDADGRGRKQLTRDFEQTASMASWSPDGRRIVFTSEICSTAVAGSTCSTAARDPTGSARPTVPTTSYSGAPAWTSQRSTLAATRQPRRRAPARQATVGGRADCEGV